MRRDRELTLGEALEIAVPDVPDVFALAMEGTLAGIVRDSALAGKRRGWPKGVRGKRGGKRTAEPGRTSERVVSLPAETRRQAKRSRRGVAVVAALMAVLLLASVAVAVALRWNVFDVLLGATPENAASLIQHNLKKVSVQDVDIEIREAAYDGMALYVLYSVRDRNATEPVGEYDEATGMRMVYEETMPAMEAANVGNWCDNIWIDGQRVSMPNMSGGMTTGSETPGEMLFYRLYRLDQERIFLDGEVTVGLPILTRVDLMALPRDADGRSILPEDEEHILYFTMNASVREGVTVETPNIEADFDGMRARVTSATFTAIKLYLTVGFDVSREVVDALGEGIKDEQGNVVMPYGRVELTSAWAITAELVDKDGNRVFETMDGFANGCQGVGDTEAYFQFPYSAEYPEEMYLAPMGEGTADMARAVRVR